MEFDGLASLMMGLRPVEAAEAALMMMLDPLLLATDWVILAMMPTVLPQAGLMVTTLVKVIVLTD